MKKFSFRLETPLRIKELKEKIEKQKLAEAINEKNKAEKSLTQLELSKKDTWEKIEKQLYDSIKTNVLSDFGVYSAHISSKIDRQKIVVKNTHRFYEERVHSYIISRREKQILEKVKEKKFAVYNKNLNAEEQKITDEVANINYDRLERDTNGNGNQ
ncbi:MULTISPECIES: flagellar export protein FliJ [Tepidanaerobacter]|uniref:flagellar export protein FliJ n=1 Tax=Tepidanaerobacter TaxID=499228 RepID=UPI000AA3C0D4|nr:MULTISPECIES: flagellar export protein FliJ [Tepidanaerobacter]